MAGWRPSSCRIHATHPWSEEPLWPLLYDDDDREKDDDLAEDCPCKGLEKLIQNAERKS
jgi:hypothetical protein